MSLFKRCYNSLISFFGFLKQMETSISIEKLKESFECELPQVVGAIDVTHVEILAPSNESRVDYFSRKQKYTVVNQGVVGANFDISRFCIRLSWKYSR